MTEADYTQHVLQTGVRARECCSFIYSAVCKRMMFRQLFMHKSHFDNFYRWTFSSKNRKSLSNLHKSKISVKKQVVINVYMYSAGSGATPWPYVDYDDVRFTPVRWVQSDRDACRSRSTVTKVTQPVWGQVTAAGDRCTVRHERLTRTRRAGCTVPAPSWCRQGWKCRPPSGIVIIMRRVLMWGDS